MSAYNLVRHNKEGVLKVADVVAERRELYGDEVIELLESADLRKPDVDLLDEESWPRV